MYGMCAPVIAAELMLGTVSLMCRVGYEEWEWVRGEVQYSEVRAASLLKLLHRSNTVGEVAIMLLAHAAGVSH
jgi:hypothetical protein